MCLCVYGVCNQHMCEVSQCVLGLACLCWWRCAFDIGIERGLALPRRGLGIGNEKDEERESSRATTSLGRDSVRA